MSTPATPAFQHRLLEFEDEPTEAEELAWWEPLMQAYRQSPYESPISDDLKRDQA